MDHSPRPSLLSTTHVCARQTSGGEIHTHDKIRGPPGKRGNHRVTSPAARLRVLDSPEGGTRGAVPRVEGRVFPLGLSARRSASPSAARSRPASVADGSLWYRVRAARPFQRPPHQIKELCRGLSGTWWARVAVATGGSEDRLRTKHPGTTLETPLQLFKRRGWLCRMIVI